MSRLIKILPYAVLVLILVVRVWDPSLVQQSRNLAFDTYQRLLPRVWVRGGRPGDP